MDSVLIWTVTMIFVGAVVGLVIRYRSRDACLKTFAGYFTVVELPGGKTVWGELDVFHNAVELLYPTPHPDGAGTHHETSFILYKEHLDSLLSLRRYHDELSVPNQGRRENEVRRTYHPNALRRLRRRIVNLMNLFRDAMIQAFGAFMGTVKKTSTSTLITTQDARITDTANTLLSATAAAYEPLLERYIGRKVVLELTTEAGTTEYCGILKEYTGEYICVLDVQVSESFPFRLGEPEQLKANRNLDFELQLRRRDGAEGGFDVEIGIQNHGKLQVEVVRAEAAEFRQSLEIAIKPGERAECRIEGVPAIEDGVGDLELIIHTRREVDMVVPRSRGIIRHGAEERPRFQL